MWKKPDISSYLHPEAENGETKQDAATKPPLHDPTYSVVLGYGWGKPKLLPRDRNREPAN
jgi:hypothetical protein